MIAGGQKEVRMYLLRAVVLSAVLMAATVGVVAGIEKQNRPGMMPEVVVTAEVPERLRGVMPEVVIQAKAPALLVTGDGPADGRPEQF